MFRTVMLKAAAGNKNTHILTTYDALSARSLSQLSVFTNWLSANNVKGILGEYGWPGTSSAGTDPNHDSRWDIVADQWLKAADAALLPATSWTSAEWSINLKTYRNATNDNSPLSIATSSALIVEKHLTTANYLRGINLAGGDFGDFGSYGALNRGTLGTQYYYPNPGDWTYLASRGVKLVRLPIRWERFQSTLKTALDTTEISRLQTVLSAANSAGIVILIDVHNYGRYDTAATGNSSGSSSGVYDLGQNAPSGIGGTMVSCFADFWQRMAAALAGHAGLWGYGLVNEPHDLTGGVATWQTASAAATEAIRLNDTTTYISVGGYSYATVPYWSAQNGSTAWLTTTIPAGQPNAGQPRNRDPHLVFEGHHYWDNDQSGSYQSSYDTELTNAMNQGFTSYQA
jgi:aryl-phospho-beta-D-glucosidase BglC (GH1 family)